MDTNTRSRENQPTDSIAVFKEMVWCHFVLACCLAVVPGIAVFLFYAQAKKLDFSKHPILSMLQWLIAPLAAIAFGAMLLGSYLYDEHRVALNIGLSVAYLIWLFYAAELCCIGHRRVRRLTAMAPWLLAAALVLAAVPWHGVADAACSHGCSREEADAIATETPAPRGSIGKHELSGKVTVVAGGYAGGGMLDCSPDFKGSGTRSRWPEDGTYDVERLDYRGFPAADGHYLQFKESSLFGDGIVGVCRDTRP